jgi:hypothetical protein
VPAWCLCASFGPLAFCIHCTLLHTYTPLQGYSQLRVLDLSYNALALEAGAAFGAAIAGVCACVAHNIVAFLPGFLLRDVHHVVCCWVTIGVSSHAHETGFTCIELIDSLTLES